MGFIKFFLRNIEIVFFSVSKPYLGEWIRSLRFYRLIKRTKYSKNIRVLEIGPHNFILSRLLLYEFNNVMAIDIDPNTIKKLNNPNLNFIIGDVELFTFSNKFDIIIAIDVFQYFNFPEQTYRKLLDLLSDQGVLYFTNPKFEMNTIQGNKYEIVNNNGTAISKLISTDLSIEKKIIYSKENKKIDFFLKKIKNLIGYRLSMLLVPFFLIFYNIGKQGESVYIKSKN